MTALADQLRRFHAAVTGGAPLDTARTLVDDGPIAARTRLQVYAHAYTARIAGVLAFDYPKLAALRGSLQELVFPYLRAHPPAHPSLREVGRHLASFLAASGEPAHLVEVARLERARTEAFDGGADVRTLERAALATLGAEAFPSLPLQLVPSSHVLALATNADDLWDALEAGRRPPAPASGDRTVLVWRREVTVVHRTLDPDEASLIRRLVTGTSFAGACELLGAHASPAERAIELLLRWVDAANLRA